MDHINDIYWDIRQFVMSPGDDSMVWNDTENGLRRSFVRFFERSSHNPYITLDSFAFVSYSVHIVLLNAAPWRREWLINNWSTIVGLLPLSVYDFNVVEDGHDLVSSLNASCVRPQDSALLHSRADGRERSMLVLQHALARTLRESESV